MITINGTTGVTTPGISNSEGYTGDGLSVAAGAPAGAVTVDSGGNVGIGTSSPASQLNVNASTGGDFRLTRTSAGGGTSTLGSISFGNQSASSLSSILATEGGATNASILSFYTATGGTSSERMRIDSSGKVLINTTSQIDGAYLLQIQHSSTVGGALFLAYGNGNNYPLRFYNNTGSSVGYVLTNTTSTTYATSSDYRLKENIQPIQGALATVALLNPVTYNWKADGSAGQGFIAHELQAVVPDCVTGEKDAVDAEGKPVYQGVDTSFLVATLTAAIQELKAELDAVKAELKGAA